MSTSQDAFGHRLGNLFLALSVVCALALGGCSKGDDTKSASGNSGGSSATVSSSGADPKFVGTYEDAKEKMTLVLQPDHKGTLSADGKPGDIAWETAADKLTIHMSTEYTMFRTADGNLRDEEGKTWIKK